VDRFFASGLAEEVSRLLEQGVPRDANAFKAIGYREVLAALESGRPVSEVRDEVRSKTRRYAKRQRTWFRKEPGLVWLDASRSIAEHVHLVADAWRRFTGAGGYTR
jgi:tRNA dimethylallyltransferase